ncbi:GNAT family N-acetyltransferase [Candidatus Dependentiae bacterium]
MDKEVYLRETNKNDFALIKKLVDKHWGGEPLIIRGKKYYPSSLDGIIALKEKEVVGFLVYDIQNEACEIVVFEVFEKYKGIGTLILNKLIATAKSRNCNKLCLMTTNDNLDALRFYQRRGFHICGIQINSMVISRKMKPSIPEIGDYGIPMRDEIDLELFI